MKNKVYQKKYKDARRKEGYIQLNVWIKPEWKQAIQELINKLRKG